MILFSDSSLESLLFSGRPLENDPLLESEIQKVEADIQGSNPNLLYAVDLLISLMTIDSIQSNKKEFNLKKDFKEFNDVFWSNNHRKLKGLIKNYFSNNKNLIFNHEYIKLGSTNFKAKHVSRHYFQNYSIWLCNMLTVSDHLEGSKFISENKLPSYYYYFINVPKLQMLNLIKEDINSYKNFKRLPKEACELIINKDPSRFFMLNPEFLDYDLFYLGLKKNFLSSKETFSFEKRNNLYSKFNFNVFTKKEIENLIALDFDIVNYINISEFEDFVCDRIRDKYSRFNKIKNPSLEICLFSLKIEEFSLLKDNVDLTDIGIENNDDDILIRKAKLFLSVKLVDNPSHKITIKNLENKIKLKKLIGS